MWRLCGGNGITAMKIAEIVLVLFVAVWETAGKPIVFVSVKNNCFDHTCVL